VRHKPQRLVASNMLGFALLTASLQKHLMADSIVLTLGEIFYPCRNTRKRLEQGFVSRDQSDAQPTCQSHELAIVGGAATFKRQL